MGELISHFFEAQRIEVTVEVFTMGHPSRLQISDLETIESVFEQEIPLEEAEKIVGGSKEPKEPKGPKDPGWGCIIVPDADIL